MLGSSKLAYYPSYNAKRGEVTYSNVIFHIMWFISLMDWLSNLIQAHCSTSKRPIEANATTLCDFSKCFDMSVSVELG